MTILRCLKLASRNQRISLKFSVSNLPLESRPYGISEVGEEEEEEEEEAKPYASWLGRYHNRAF